MCDPAVVLVVSASSASDPIPTLQHRRERALRIPSAVATAACEFVAVGKQLVVQGRMLTRFLKMFVPSQEPRLGGTDGEAKDSLTPNSTPTQSRKTRPKSNLFRKTDDNREKEKKVIDGIGSGRSIPIKQGYLYKRTCKPLNKEWKTKKYVALTDDARLIYHPSIQDYVQNAHGKEIDLSRVTVKIPGVNFRQTGGQQVNSCSSTAVSAAAASNSSSNNNGGGGARSQGDVSGSDKLSTSLENTAGGGGGGGVLDGTQSPSEGIINTGNRLMSQQGSKETSKKRYRRVKSTQKTGATDGYESEGYEFQLISMDRAWNFEAHSAEERDEWVSHIDRAIITRLQLLESSNSSNSRQQQQQQQQGGHSLHPHFHPHHHQQNQSGHHQEASGNSGSGGGGGWGGGHGTTGSDPGAAAAGGGGRGGGGGGSGGVDEAMAKSLRAVAGNDACADCGAPDPDWASLNLGELVCIECSGVHRRLGTHISRVRSLLLDDWTPEAAAVMRAIGNTLANSVWEAAVPANLNSRRKPDSRSSKEEMEAWIRAKYEQREFLPPLPYPEAPLQQQLIDAIARQDTRQVVLCLARATPETVNAPYSRQDSRAAIHIAATLGNIVYLQLLLWYNGDPKVVDSEGRNAFYYAHCSCHFDCANFLARNGCPRQTVPAPALAHFAAASQQQQQALPPTTKSQQQQQVGMTPKHHSAMAYQQQQQQPQPPTPQQQQQQMVMGYRGGPGVPQPQQQLPPPTPQAAAGGFAPVFMHNIMPGSAGNHPMHGTMGGGGGGLASGATVAAGATLPRRRGPFGPPAATAGGAGGMYLPSQPIPTSSTTVANSMANRPLPVAGAFDPSTMAGATNQAQNAKPGDPPEISI